jgi:hypothetical protein
LLEAARAELSAEDFEDGGARALAGEWWEHGVVMPDGDGEAAALARELASAPVEDQDHRAEVIGALRRLVVRRLQRERRRRQSTLAAARGDDATRLMQEIQEIARTLQKLST